MTKSTIARSTTVSSRQAQLEEEAKSLGVSRYRKERLAWSLKDPSAQPEADTKPGRKLVNTYVKPLSDAIEEWRTDVTAGKARRQALMLKFVNEIDSDTCAFLTLRGIINGFSGGSSIQEVVKNIVHPIIDDINYRRLKEQAPGYAFVLQDNFKKATSARHRSRVNRNAMQKADVQVLTIDSAERQRLGNLLIDMAITSTGICELRTISNGPKDASVVVRPTEQTMTWLEETHARCELMAPLYLPMVVKPKPWTTPKDGGYYFYSGAGYGLVKCLNTAYLEELEHWDMPKVYKAVNAIQETPWRVNKGVFETMRNIWDSGRTLGKLPTRDPMPLPAKPLDIDTNPEALKAWKIEAKKVHEANNKMCNKRLSISQKLWIAEKFLNDPEIYFPHSLDWRGRVYPLGAGATMNPQGDDTGKALLEFAKGKPLGEEGAYWLAVHLAGLFGVDKVPFDDRVAWVEDHSFELCLCAQDPLEYQFWTEADKPYQALAAIFEWDGFQTHGYDFVSHLPIAMDGSNNGAQHLSAMGRDSRATVNLVPSERPQDIYMDVANVVSARVAQLAAEGDEMAMIWDQKITRSVAKRPVMTLCYGATRRGMAGQILDEVEKSIAEGKPLIITDDKRKACDWLAGEIFPAIASVTVSAVAIMDWLKDTARVAASNDLPVRWVTPAGFPILQQYQKTNGRVIESVIAGARTQITVVENTETLNRRRQAAGISPNFVHSLDAAHLMLTIGEMVDQGLTDFAMIHDSYGCHACDVPVMNKAIRKTFVEMYTEDVLDDFRNQIIEQLPEELAGDVLPLPPKGDLDISVINDSQFFFA